MKFSAYLDADWRPALGCTEPAAVAYGAARAAEQARGGIRSVHLRCDRLVYKNCHAAVIPHSDGKAGLEWALAIGALLPDSSAELECFQLLDDAILRAAEALIDAGGVTVEVDETCRELLVDCRVTGADGSGRAVIAGSHTRVAELERDGQPVPIGAAQDGPDRREQVDAWLRSLSFADCLRLADEMDDASRDRLREGLELNLEIARHGVTLLPEAFVEASLGHPDASFSCMVCGGVCARMSGADRPVMTLAGSGNKGITVTVPLALWGERNGASASSIDRALAVAVLLTSATTRRLGTLSSMCGCANAAGVGLAAGLVVLQGGGTEEISRAVNNIVGNVTGTICDGAKVGCGLKAATAVDAACRAAALAVSGFGIPPTNGIVAAEGAQSLENLERVARRGMESMDAEILRILREQSLSG